MMEVATYMPFQHRAFQSGYHPHYFTSTPVSNEPNVPTHYAESARRNDCTIQATSQGSHSYEEANKPSLPSISNLLGIADGERGSLPNQGNDSPVSQQQHHYHNQQQQQQTSYPPTQTEIPSAQAYHTLADPVMHHGTAIRLTPPPLRSDSVVDPTGSPSIISAQAPMSSGPTYFLGSSLNNMEPHQQRGPPVMKRHSVPLQHTGPMYTTSPYAIPQYNSSPSAMSASSYYSADGRIHSAASCLYHQRSLPSNFPPVMTAPIVTASGLPAPNPWEHHHYINPSSHTSYPQSQDRYICATCHKAFSRPSSLKIHSHSHTGEKPFKCPHPGCGKAFSVRSNMKRHERGCHTGGSSIMGTA